MQATAKAWLKGLGGSCGRYRMVNGFTSYNYLCNPYLSPQRLWFLWVLWFIQTVTLTVTIYIM